MHSKSKVIGAIVLLLRFFFYSEETCGDKQHNINNLSVTELRQELRFRL